MKTFRKFTESILSRVFDYLVQPIWWNLVKIATVYKLFPGVFDQWWDFFSSTTYICGFLCGFLHSLTISKIIPDWLQNLKSYLIDYTYYGLRSYVVCSYELIDSLRKATLPVSSIIHPFWQENVSLVRVIPWMIKHKMNMLAHDKGGQSVL